MIDAALLLWSHALLDYAKAATTRLLTRMRRDATANISGPTTKRATVEHGPYGIACKVVYAVAALVFIVIVGVFFIGAYTILTSVVSL